MEGGNCVVTALAALFLLSFASPPCSAFLQGQQELEDFQRKHNNTMSDLIFLVDTSGSLRYWSYASRAVKNGFDDEKVFVNALLSHIRISVPATRVSVILFGTRATIEINYISNINPSNHKCNFKTSFSDLRFRSGMTNMHDAFKLADDIIFGSLSGNKRPTKQVKTAVFLLTDGEWNDGGNPATYANKLKNNGVEVFSIGVTSGVSTSTLRGLASPNRYFHYTDFSQFRELATYLRGDPYEKDWLIGQPASKCGECDSEADCSCGLVSGEYKCGCFKGFYGTGYTGDCKKCPPATYKDYDGYTLTCTGCPAHSSHTREGAKSKSLCVCNTGYEGSPARETPCIIKKCDQFPIPLKGHLRGGSCNNQYLTSCTVECDEGYELTAPGTRTCGLNSNAQAQWTGNAPTCRKITCNPLDIPDARPRTGSCDKDDASYGTKCTIICDVGHILKGDKVRVCQLNKQWSGTASVCEEVRCPTLNTISLAQVLPSNCVSTDQRFHTVCTFTCARGYVMNGTLDRSLTRTCQVSGQWNGVSRACVDNEPPTITCPGDKFTNTTFRKPYAELSWAKPNVSDNSNNEAELIVTSDYEPPHKFNVGKTLVRYTVIDGAKLQSQCSFRVTVADQEPPYVTSCPPDQSGMLESGTEMRVNWDKAEFEDNSDIPPVVTSSRKSSDMFRVGTEVVTYTATDGANNVNRECAFKVTITVKGCQMWKPPVNGALACHSLGGGSKYCQVNCNDQRDFAYKPAMTYLCAEAIWRAYPPGIPMIGKKPWPDCSLRYDPASAAVRLMTAFYYYAGDCNSDEAKATIKQNFIAVTSTNVLIPFGVSCFTTPAACNVANINVYCGDTDKRKRRRRSSVRDVHIKVDFVAKSKSSSTTLSELETILAQDSKPVLERNIKTVNWQSLRTTADLEYTKASISNPEAYCSDEGAVIGRCDSYRTDCQKNNGPQDPCSCNGDTGKLVKCIRCPAGTYYNSLYENCTKCLPGTFSSQDGRLQCTKCPEGSWTLGNQAANFTSCTEKCKPGYFSSTGLAPCFQCPRGKYATGFTNTQCTVCPQGTTTILAGAYGREDCGMKCAAGTYSSSGVEPCLPCPKGTYQSAIGSMVCADCDGTKSTDGPGADSANMCKDINDCASSPCNNGGQCEDLKDGYRCACAQGYTGQRCETEKDECLSDPCYQGSTCIDKVNGYECVCAPGLTGPNCDVISGLCNPNPCQNGAKCVPQPPRGACECTNGYGGEFCEMKLDFCASSPCQNGGLCTSLSDSFHCACRPGFLGAQCEVNRDDCANSPCMNAGTCSDQVDGYRCSCKKGFAGSRCMRNINNCYPNPCGNGGTCADKVNSFDCSCKPGYSGHKCQTKVSPDFDVNFPFRVVTSSSSTRNITDLRAFTVAFWMRTSDTENPGTPLSYATTDAGKVLDNALVLQDYGAFTLHVNNQKHFIGVSANDGHWHHVCVTWTNTNGAWVFYLDGKNVKSASGFQTGAVIRGGGVMVLGQEQDKLGDGFNPEEAFIGGISQLNVWNNVLAANDVENLAHSCQASEGNVRAWGDFRAGLEGVYVITPKSYACDLSSVLRGYRISHKVRIPAHDDKTLSSQTPEQCAATCEQEVTFPCRSFDYDTANRKCYLSRAVASDASQTVRTDGFDVYQTECLDDIGMESKAIPDSALTASSSLDSTSGATSSRLQSTRVSGVQGQTDSRGGWSPSVNNNQQYLQVDLSEVKKITGVATQGAESSSEWVTSYKLEYSTDGNQWSPYSTTLSGNTDDSTVVRHQVQSFTARYVRFRPKAWRGRIALRVEVYGCGTGSASKPAGPVVDSCASVTCASGGTCVNLFHGFRCLCVTGYQGDRCQTAAGCSMPASPANGQVMSTTGSGHGGRVTVTCNAGYQLRGSGVRTCLRGQWSGTVPECIDVDECAAGHCAQLCTNTEGSFKCACRSGYTLNSDGRTCNDIDECTMGVCSHKCFNTAGGYRCECPAGMALATGSSRTCKDKDECATSNGGCEHQCSNGYLRSSCHCRGGYGLESDNRNCAEIRCPATNAPANGKQSIQGESILDNTLSITCNPGYRLVGPPTRTCQANGKWSGAGPRCEAVLCIAIGTIKNGACRITAGQSYGSYAQFSCNLGYALVGVARRTCQQDGTWSGAQPRCVRADCPVLSAPTNGQIEGMRREIGSTVRASCITGYKVTPADAAFRTCATNKQWTGNNPTCTIVNCGDPGVPWHGFRDGTNFQYQGAVTYRCRLKHHLEGALRRVCGADGKWSGELPKCLERSCGNPGAPTNGQKVGANHTYEATVTFVCNKGYSIQGSSSRTCQTTGQWTGQQPTCNIRNCGDPGSPSNGLRIGSTFTYESTLVFDCHPGYQLQGSIVRKCQDDGTWSGTHPTCIPSNCGSIVHGPSGTIQSTNFPNNYLSNQYCTWEIRVPQGKKVRVDFTELRTESGKDFVLIYDTGATEPIVAFSGVTDKPRALTSSGNSLRVRFISDGANVNNGFQLKYTQTDCGGMITSKTGEIRSPGFPNGYPNSISCVWLIRMRNTKIALRLQEFQTQTSYDRLAIAIGPWSTSALMINLSGPVPISGDIIYQEYMWLHFHSNARNDRSYKGFRATFKPCVYPCGQTRKK